MQVTYRERREARADRLRGWADGRDAKAAAAGQTADSIASMIPMGQPILVGHHSERRHRKDLQRIDDGMRARVENGRMADSMRSRADNIEAQAAAAIYSDDDDAIERLEEKLAGLEAKREQMKAENAAFRKEHREKLKGMTAYERDCARPHAGYSISNLGGVISSTRKRIEQLRYEAANGGPADRTITARYGGACEDCGAQIERGAVIRYSRSNGARCAPNCNEEAS